MRWPTLNAGFLLAVTALVASIPPAFAQHTPDRPIVVSHPVLAASVERLNLESPTWRDALRAVAVTGRRTVLVTPDKVNGAFDSETLAQAQAVADDRSRVDAVIVV